jgi:hypothetical protein
MPQWGQRQICSGLSDTCLRNSANQLDLTTLPTIDRIAAVHRISRDAENRPPAPALRKTAPCAVVIPSILKMNPASEGATAVLAANGAIAGSTEDSSRSQSSFGYEHMN